MSMTTRYIKEVRWERGGKVMWRWMLPSGSLGKRYSNRDLRPTDEQAVRAAFAAQGADLSRAELQEGRIVACPRCRGTGYYCGGRCFRCFGNSPKSWEPA